MHRQSVRRLGPRPGPAQPGGDQLSGRFVDGLRQLRLGPLTLIAPAAGPWPGLAEAAAAAGWRLILKPADLYAGAEALEPQAPAARADQGGHILLSSGTTGAHKAVLIDTANQLRNLPLRSAALGVTPASLINVFDFGGWTAIGYQWPVCAWSLGAGVVIHQGPDRFRSLATPGLTHLMTQPGLLAALLDAPAEAALRNDAVALIFGGGMLAPAQWRAARERLTRDVRTIVGSTEVGTFTVTPIETVEDLQWHRIDPNHRVQVVDDQDQPLPAGRMGLVRVATTGVDSYLDDPQATRQFFRGGYFHTGDLGTIREDGRLALQGRVTDVINLFGHKIATGPIEALLQERLDAQAVCVFSAPGAEGEEVHVAIQPGPTVTMPVLRAALQAAFPDLADVRVHGVTAFPRNHMGKIERATLKAQLLPGARI